MSCQKVIRQAGKTDGRGRGETKVNPGGVSPVSEGATCHCYKLGYCHRPLERPLKPSPKPWTRRRDGRLEAKGTSESPDEGTEVHRRK